VIGGALKNGARRNAKSLAAKKKETQTREQLLWASTEENGPEAAGPQDGVP